MATAEKPARARRTKEAPKATSSRARKATRPASAKSAATKSARAAGQPAASTATRRKDSALLRRTAVTVPVVNLRVPLLSPRVPDLGAVPAQTKWAAQAVRSNLPPVDRVLYYGGLGVLAAAGVVEWPVAAAVGAGVWVAGRAGRRGRGPAGST